MIFSIDFSAKQYMSDSFTDSFPDIQPRNIKVETIASDTNIQQSVVEQLREVYKRVGPFATDRWDCDYIDCIDDINDGIYVGKLMPLVRVGRQKFDRYAFRSIDGNIIATIKESSQARLRKNGWKEDNYALLSVNDDTAMVTAINGPLEKIEHEVLGDVFNTYFSVEKHNKFRQRIGNIFDRLPIKEFVESDLEVVCSSYVFAAALNPKILDNFITIGYTEPEPSNSYDSNAVAVYDYIGTKVAYLYKKEQGEYYRMCNSYDSYPCIIHGVIDSDGKLHGRVQIYPRYMSSIKEIANEIEKRQKYVQRPHSSPKIRRPHDDDTVTIPFKLSIDMSKSDSNNSKDPAEEDNGCAIIGGIIILILLYWIFS